MQQNIQSCCKSEEALVDAQWDKDAHMLKLQQIIQSSSRSEEAHTHSHWREAILLYLM